MEEKVLLFLDNNKSFITKTIIKKLEEAGHKCVLTTLDTNEINKYRGSIAGYVFWNLGDRDEIDSKAWQFLKDMCVDDNCCIYAMGYPDEIARIRDDSFPASLWGEFHRPLNAVQLSEEIDKLASSEKKVEAKHILIVDDSGTMLNTIKGWLQDDYRIFLANSAANALTFLGRNKPDLVLLDYEMPICSGPQLLEMMRNDPEIADVPVIFLTGHDDAESVKSVLALKPSGYLLKSRPKEEIKRAIADFFAKNR